MKGDQVTGDGGAMMESEEIDGLSYERALGELDQIIERLERGAVALDEAIAAYERGARLAQHCSRLLDRTEQKVSQLVVGSGGRITEKPLDTERTGAELPVVIPPGAPVAPVPGRRSQFDVDPDDIPF